MSEALLKPGLSPEGVFGSASHQTEPLYAKWRLGDDRFLQLCRCLYFRPLLSPPECVFTRIDIYLLYHILPRAPTALQLPSARDS